MPEAQGDSNPTKSPEVITSDPEQKLEKPLSPKAPKVGLKKQIAGRLVGAAIALSTMGVPGDNPIQNPNLFSINNNNPEATQSLSVQDLEQRAEQLFHIQIASPQEGIVVLADGTEVKPNEWTKEEIADLMEAFDKLPLHFYLPGPEDVRVYLPSLSRGSGSAFDPSKDIQQQEKLAQERQQQIKQQNDRDDIAAIRKDLGEDFQISQDELRRARNQGYFERRIEGAFPVKFIIPDVIPLNRRLAEANGLQQIGYYRGQCYCGTSSASPEVLLSSGIFDGDFHDAFIVITHELIHRVSKPEDYRFVSDMLGVSQDTDFANFIRDTYGLNDIKKGRERYHVLEAGGFNSSAINDVENAFRYGTTNANEFISVAGEFYVDGKEKFLKIYSIFIGEEKAQRLYDYMRDNIFRGKEYQEQR